MDTWQTKDQVGKRLFRHRRLVRDMLLQHVAGNWIQDAEFGSLRPMSTEYLSRAGHRRFGDMLWTVQLVDGRQVLVMLEIQSGVDQDMAARMCAYTGILYESLTPAARGVSGRYPAVLPLVPRQPSNVASARPQASSPLGGASMAYRA
ncbi:MAG: Rpn family recombination-promoting nuclease/putative transposase [Pseudomonadales bacterium]|nr:Rpn family recombination-promoting nuclease/putative transposase [Pseudomonadales bacterium]